MRLREHRGGAHCLWGPAQGKLPLSKVPKIEQQLISEETELGEGAEGQKSVARTLRNRFEKEPDLQRIYKLLK